MLWGKAVYFRTGKGSIILSDVDNSSLYTCFQSAEVQLLPLQQLKKYTSWDMRYICIDLKDINLKQK